MVAHRDVVPFLTDSLKRMEYRGYDSAGIAVRNVNGDQVKLTRRRAEGKISALNAVIAHAPISGEMGIGHIRWASHGQPTTSNAHPHRSTGVALVHNGIIENWQILKDELLNKGYPFESETDTEVIAHLIQSKLDDGEEPLTAFRKAVKRLHGAYALAVMIDSAPDTLFVAKLGSPLIVGQGDNENYVGSDALALAPVTDKVRYLEEGDHAVITSKHIDIFDQSDTPVKRKLVETGLTANDTDKGGYSHFMLKEIHEQPDVIQGLIDQYIDRDTLSVKPLAITFDPNHIDRIAIIACGTAYHAGMLGKYWIETLARISVDIDFASEYRYRDLIQPKRGVFIAVSQSGETADTLAALRRAKAEQQTIVSVVNVESSAIARESTDVLPLFAGTEIGVASTKAFIAQAMVLLCLAIFLGRQRDSLSAEDEQILIKDLIDLPSKITHALADERTSEIQALAHTLVPASDVLFLGRGRQFPIALEAALKLKEISYIHAEGYAAGEMKHGAIALIDDNVPVICLCPTDEVLEKSLSNMQEVAARKAQVILVAEQAVCTQNNFAKALIMPQIHPLVSPLLYVVPMQLLSYYTAVLLGKDVDQPRNLAKSVTIE